MPTSLRAARDEGRFFRLCSFSFSLLQKTRNLQLLLTARRCGSLVALFVEKNIVRGVYIYPPGGVGRVRVCSSTVTCHPRKNVRDTPTTYNQPFTHHVHALLLDGVHTFVRVNIHPNTTKNALYKSIIYAQITAYYYIFVYIAQL